MKNKIKNILKYIILFLIQTIEAYEYRKLELDEDDISKKILDTIELNDLEIDTPQGFKKITHIHKTQPYTIWQLETEGGLNLDCADNHILINEDGAQIFTKDLKIGIKINTKFGLRKITKIKKLPFKISMYDVTVDSKEHLFYSNNIVSHNTVTVSAFFAWYLCFHHDRNAAILANKQLTATEIVSKVVDIFKGLPFYLKPGIQNIGALGMRLDNGCQLLSQATTKTAQIGFTIHILYADEFAHIQANIVDDFWRSIYPTLSSSNISQCIISSTPNGQGNLFFELWDASNKQKNSFIPIRVDYWQVPGHDEKWAANMRRDFGEERFAQEYELQFNVASKLLLGVKEMSFAKRIEKQYVFHHLEKSRISEELYRNLKWHPSFDPNEQFNENKDRFFISVDTGEGKEEEEKKDNDYNILTIYKLELKSPVALKKLRKDEYQIKNMFKMVQVGLYRDNIKDEEIAAKVCRSLIYDVFGEESCTVILEMNFNGKNFLSQLTSHDSYYDGLIMHTYHTKPIPGEKPPPKKPGFKVTSDKDYFCKLGKRLIGDKILVPSDTITIKEFSAFGRDNKGKYRGIAMHDDTVMATLNLSRLYEEEEYPVMLENFLDELQDSKSKRLISEYMNSYVEEQTDTSDNMFKILYGNDGDNVNTNLNNIIANSNLSKQYTYKSSSSFSTQKS